jgi:hypothetical protein
MVLRHGWRGSASELFWMGGIFLMSALSSWIAISEEAHDQYIEIKINQLSVSVFR